LRAGTGEIRAQKQKKDGKHVKREFERIAPRLYRRTYKTADGAESVLCYARFVCKLKGKRRLFALGGDLKQAKELLKDLDYRNRHREDFDATKRKKTLASKNCSR